VRLDLVPHAGLDLTPYAGLEALNQSLNEARN